MRSSYEIAGILIVYLNVELGLSFVSKHEYFTYSMTI